MPNNCVTATLLLCFLRSLRWVHSLYTAGSRYISKAFPRPQCHGLPSSERVRKAGSLIAMFHFIKPVKVLHQMLCPSGGSGFFQVTSRTVTQSIDFYLAGPSITSKIWWIRSRPRKLKRIFRRFQNVEWFNLIICPSGVLARPINETFIYPLDTVLITPTIPSSVLHHFFPGHFLTSNLSYFPT